MNKMNAQTEIILDYIMEDIHEYREWLYERRCHIPGRTKAEKIMDGIRDYIHNKKHSSLMIQLCDIILEDVDWDEIADKVENYRE